MIYLLNVFCTNNQGSVGNAAQKYPSSLVAYDKIEPWHAISNNVAFWQVSTQTSLCSLLLSLETANGVQSVA